MKTVKTPNDFEEIQLNLIVDSKHDWLLKTKHTAKGYGVTGDSITKHIQRNPEEFLEGKHYIRGTDNLSLPYKNSQPRQIFWTKRGIIRLGFFIKSQQAKKFRDWAEDLTLQALQSASLTDAPDRIAIALKEAIDPLYERMSAIENRVFNNPGYNPAIPWTAQVAQIMKSAGVTKEKQYRSIHLPGEIAETLPAKLEISTLTFISTVLKTCIENGKYTEANSRIESDFKMSARNIGTIVKRLNTHGWIDITGNGDVRRTIKATEKTIRLYEQKELFSIGSKK